jgi:glycosyltransferase involved in cell wall biosynthesis
MNASVVVCTFNRCDLLAKVLDSLECMVIDPAVEWEVLIVDNNSTDSTAAIGKSFVRKHSKRFRYLLEKQQGKSFALNAGIRTARGEILAFTDDDLTVDQNWLAQLLNTFERFNCAGVGGKIVPVWECSRPDWFQSDSTHQLMSAIVSFDLGETPRQVKTAFFGANMAFKKEVFQKHGGFRIDLGPTVGSEIRGEDTEFCRRLLTAGEELIYTPDAVVYHPVEKRRIEKSYFQDWYLGRGRASILEGGIPQDVIRYFGVPRYMLALLCKRISKWVFSFNPKLRFYNKLDVYELIGQILESRRTSLSGK